jgi:hypothetical protein
MKGETGMQTIQVNEPEFDMRITAPDHWTLIRKAVPKLEVPRQLFSTSNGRIFAPEAESSQPRPMIQTMDPSSVFLWGCLQRPGDPDPLAPDPVLDNTSLGYPFNYDQAIARESTDAREWSSTDFVWKRVGCKLGELSITIWIWEGTQAKDSTIQEARSILNHIDLRPQSVR